MSGRMAFDENSLVKAYLASKHRSQGAAQQRNDNRNPSEWEQLGNREPHAIEAEDDWQESKHPRGNPGNAGQFTSGSGGGGKKHESHEAKGGEQHLPPEHHSAKGGTLHLGLRARNAINSAVGKAVHTTKHKLKEPEFVKGAVSMGIAHIIEHYVPGAFMGGGYDEPTVGAYIEHIETVSRISAHQVIGIMKDAIHGMIEAQKGIVGGRAGKHGAHDAKEGDGEIPTEALEALVKVLDRLALKYEQVGGEVVDGGPGSGIKGHTTPKEASGAQNKQGLTESGNLAMSPSFTQENGRVEGLANNIEKQIEKGVQPSIAAFDPSEVFATQSWLSKEGGGQAVFPEYEDKPVLARTSDGKYLILDGHHRFDSAAQQGKLVQSYFFQVPASSKVVQDAAKVTKEEARYTDGPTDYQPCKRCVMWRDPDTCTKVEGQIAPNGHCKFWYAAKIEPAKDGIVQDHMAYDQGSVRNFDIDGRLHVEITNISKATVNPYLGKEIPQFEELGLEPDQIYQLLRDPKELEKAAPTFNGLPLLSEHKPTSAADHEEELVIGATGTDAVFEFPYLKNSLVIWPEYAIEEVEGETKKELSCGYRYRPDMTPGIFQGMRYDGVMRDIIGNHVALVKEGRAGADVHVGDSMENIKMAKPKMSRQAAVAIGFLSSVIRPQLAADAKLDLRPIFAGVTAKNFKERKKAIGSALTKSLKGKLATDATIGEVAELLDMIEAHGVEPGPAPGGAPGGQEDMDALPPSVEQPMAKAAEPFAGEETPEEEAAEEHEMPMVEGGSDPAAQVEALLKGKVDDATLAEVCELIRGAPAGAHDELEEDPNKDKGTGTGSGSPGGSKEGAAEGQVTAKDEENEEAEDEEESESTKRMKAADKKQAKDNPPPFKGMPKPGGKMVTQDAMNAAIKAATEAATKNALSRQREIRDAERAVRPWVGDIAIACDSAAAVYKTALKMLNVQNLDSIDPSAYRTILELHPMAGTRQKAQQSEIAMDEASSSNYADRFPDAMRIGVL